MAATLKDYIEQAGQVFAPLLEVIPKEVLLLTTPLIVTLDENDFLEHIDKQYHLLFKAFFRKHLASLPTEDDVFQAPAVSKSNALVLRGQVCPSALKSMATHGGLVADKLPEWAKFNLVPDQLSAVTIVDLSENNLMDEDLQYVALLVESLPACKYLSLRNNRLHGVDVRIRDAVKANLLRILRAPRMEAVEVTVNALASIDNKELFAELATKHPNEFLKLIWIPKPWLEARHWKVLIPDTMLDKLLEPVFVRHEHFYKQYPF